SRNASSPCALGPSGEERGWRGDYFPLTRDRKSTRLNSSHVRISYAVFWLKKNRKTELDLDQACGRWLLGSRAGAPGTQRGDGNRHREGFFLSSGRTAEAPTFPLHHSPLL